MNTTALAPSDQQAADLAMRVRAEQLRNVYANNIPAAIVTVLGIALLSFVQSGTVSDRRLIIFAAIILSVTAIRLAVGLIYHRIKPGLDAVPAWTKLTTITIAASGICWGAVGVYLIPANAPVQQAFAVLTVVCFASGALVTLAHIWHAYVLFIVPVVVTIPARLVMLDEPNTTTLAIAFIIFWVYLLGASRRLSQTLASTIALKLENAVLAEKAQAETRRVEATVTELETLTQELRESKETTERSLEQITRDISLAKAMQESILPHDFPSTSAYDVATFIRATRFVGGDFYDVFTVDDHRIGVAIADVSGKGMPAALFMATTRVLLDTAAKEQRSPAAVLTDVNVRLCEQNPIQLFVTLFYAVIDTREGTVTYSNGGHDHPYLVRAGGSTEMIDGTGDMGLGVADDVIFSEKALHMKPGDTLFLYTDGVTEAYNGKDDMYGERRLTSQLHLTHGMAVDDAISHIVADVDQFVGAHEQSDDLTCLAFRLKAGDGSESRMRALRALQPDPPDALLELAIVNDIREIAGLQDQVRAFCEQWSVPGKQQFQITLCLEEHLVNLISYAYEDDEAHTITVSMKRRPGQIYIEILDDGAPFNPLSVAPTQIADSLADQEIGGQGIGLIRSYMDDIAYETRRDGRNRFCMVRYLRRAGDRAGKDGDS